EQKHAERIFGFFERLHSEKDYPGTGMGLAITRRIIERHQGRIEAFSEPDQGARFVITLPLRQLLTA
ncbi:ATP-binding protein, partial [Glaesserella parasuis]|uniref:ATP-binding protein n=1 Tax=Glaesserella parasuis TaxID=738 RepID=UPI003F3A3527